MGLFSTVNNVVGGLLDGANRYQKPIPNAAKNPLRLSLFAQQDPEPTKASGTPDWKARKEASKAADNTVDNVKGLLGNLVGNASNAAEGVEDALGKVTDAAVDTVEEAAVTVEKTINGASEAAQKSVSSAVNVVEIALTGKTPDVQVSAPTSVSGTIAADKTDVSAEAKPREAQEVVSDNFARRMAERAIAEARTAVLIDSVRQQASGSDSPRLDRLTESVRPDPLPSGAESGAGQRVEIRG